MERPTSSEPASPTPAPDRMDSRHWKTIVYYGVGGLITLPLVPISLRCLTISFNEIIDPKYNHEENLGVRRLPLTCHS